MVETSDGTKTGTVQVNAPTVFNNGMNTGILGQALASAFRLGNGGGWWLA